MCGVSNRKCAWYECRKVLPKEKVMNRLRMYFCSKTCKNAWKKHTYNYSRPDNSSFNGA